MARQRTMWAAAGLLLVTASPAWAQPQYQYGNQPRARAEFFIDDDFQGGSMIFEGPVARLGPTGMEDRISSVGIQGGAWEVCQDDDFRGRCVVIDRSIARLTDLGMDDTISSIRPVR